MVYAAELFPPYEGMGFGEDRYAYVTVNSKLKQEVFPAIENAIADGIEQNQSYQNIMHRLLGFQECLKKLKTSFKSVNLAKTITVQWAIYCIEI